MPLSRKEYIRAIQHGYKPGGAALSISSTDVPTSGSRDPFFQPFASNSIWNMPLGDGAIYRDAELQGQPGGANPNGFAPGLDPDKIVIQPTAPRLALFSSNAGWTGANRCNGTDAATRTAVPCPTTFIVGNSGANNSTAFLLSDSRTIAQMQPFTRCTNGAGVVNNFGTSYAWWPNQDLYGPGQYGSHGGSGLSCIGGSIRLGELRPGDTIGPAHVLRVNVYAAEALYRNTNSSLLHRWPADRADSYASTNYGTNPAHPGVNSNTDMVQGSLLALATNFAITANLVTTPSRLLAWTLKNYGAYICDDVFVAGFAFGCEGGAQGNFSTQFQSDWGYPFAMHETTAHQWRQDISFIISNLFVIRNNDSAGAAPGRGVGGGGNPILPLAPPISP